MDNLPQLVSKSLDTQNPPAALQSAASHIQILYFAMSHRTMEIFSLEITESNHKQSCCKQEDKEQEKDK